MNAGISFTQTASAAMVLFALVDVLGSVPLFLGFRESGRSVNPLQASAYSFAILTVFLFLGRAVLELFNVDLSSFAIAGSLVIFIISVEMIFGVQVFKNDAPAGSATLVPVVFPLIAGPGTFTALLSMRAEFAVANIVVAIFLNMVFVYLILRRLDLAARLLGVGGVYVMRKFFGIILMAIAVRLFTANLGILLESGIA